MDNMKKIIWLTSDNFVDVDLPIVNELSKKLDIHWLVILRPESYFNKDILYINKSCRSTIFTMTMRHRQAIFFYIKIIRYIRLHNPDIIYIDALGMPYLWILVKLLLPNRKVIYAAHDVEDHVGVKNRKIIQLYKKFVFTIFKNFHVFSQYQYEIFTSRYRNKNVFVAPLFLKDFGFADVNPTDDIVTFLFFGEIRINKGLKYLIEAGNSLAKEYAGRFKIVIAGKSDNWQYYETMIQQKNVFELHIMPILNEEIPKLFLSSHYLVLPYIDVTQSGPLLIAYNYNIPVIASNLHWFKEYIKDGNNGYLFEPKNADSLKNVMENVILNHNNNYYLKLKYSLRKFVKENISIKAISEKYIHFFSMKM